MPHTYIYRHRDVLSEDHMQCNVRDKLSRQLTEKRKLAMTRKYYGGNVKLILIVGSICSKLINK